MTGEAVKVGKQKITVEPETCMLSTGIEARIIPVGASLVDDVVAQVKDPRVPVYHNEQKGRDEENPNDPEYLEALKGVSKRRAIAAMDAMILFGMELINPLPEDDRWLKKLRWLEKRGNLDLSSYELDDAFDQEFLYKRYVACGTSDLILLGKMAGLTQADIKEASESFKS